MSKSNATETNLLKLMYQAVALPWAGAASIDIHLHTADPGEGNPSTTNEAAFGGYAPVTVTRDAAGFDVVGDEASNDDLVSFPTCTSGAETITHFSTTPVGSTEIIHIGILNDARAVSAGNTLQFPANSLVIREG